jgi:hypothetical protein
MGQLKFIAPDLSTSGFQYKARDADMRWHHITNDY